MLMDKGLPHAPNFAKYAVTFPSMSRSIFTRSRLISIYSALTTLLLSHALAIAGRLRPFTNDNIFYRLLCLCIIGCRSRP